ncbi:MAG: tetratricopeptide repeat protein, partial [Chloroflexi bacterium]|nr:tetratricopeptide repeat protein [Chloroflexota bacterium]
PADQASFRRLAAFASSGFSPAAAAAVWGDDEKMANESVARLVNLSLLKVVEGESERYRLHDLLDEYAGDKLRASGEPDAANRAHAEFLIALFDEHLTYDPSTAPEVAPELDNLRAAANWATKKREGNVLALLAYRPRNWLYIVFRINEEWLSWLTASLAFGVEDRGLQANVLQAIGDVQQFRDDRDAALASYEEALRLFRAVGDRLGEANVLQALGDVQSFRKDNGAALESYRQALELFRAVGARLGEANVLKALGDVQSFRDERDAALESYRQALELFRAVGDRLGEANVRLALGGLKRRDKNIAGARADFEGALRSYRAIGDRYSEGRALYRLGDCAADEEKWEDALAAYRQAAELWQGIGLSELAGQILTPKIVDAEKQVAGKG